MPANVETMFYVREKPWHGLGTEVQEAPTSADALIYAGLDWEVIQKDVYTENGSLISGYKAISAAPTTKPLVSCPTATRWCRTRMLSSSPMICWVLV